MTFSILQAKCAARYERVAEAAEHMSNRALWSMRKRHEWLATPLKPKRSKRASRLRNGLQDARDRKAAPPAESEK